MPYDAGVNTTQSERPVTLRLAHSPDPDDAFMWWPLFELDGQPPAIDTGRLRFESVPADIEQLNRRAEAGEFEITALSCAQYARVADRYALTACGASIGDGYGPKVVARQPRSVDELRGSNPTVAIPGTRTTACAAFRVLMGDAPFEAHEMEFSAIIDAVAEGRFDAGLIIHEGQLTYSRSGLHEVADLGRWWRQRFDLPLPLGVNAVRLDLDELHGPGTLDAVTDLLEQSVRHAMDHRKQSLAYAAGFGRGLDAEQADAFCAMYVNRWTLDFGPDGRKAVHTFLREAAERGIVPACPEIGVLATASGGGGRPAHDCRD